MNTIKFNFDEWWAGLIAECSRAQGAYEILNKASQLVQELSFSNKNILLDGLMGIIKHDLEYNMLALNIIMGNARSKDLKVIKRMANERLNYLDDNQESDLTKFLCVLAKGNIRFHAPLKKYLSQKPLPKHYSCVQWAFWPENPEEFTATYSRYLSEKPLKQWNKTAIVQAFMYEPEAVKALKNKASNEFWWKDFKKSLLEQTQNGIWTTEECKPIIKALS